MVTSFEIILHVISSPSDQGDAGAGEKSFEGGGKGVEDTGMINSLRGVLQLSQKQTSPPPRGSSLDSLGNPPNPGGEGCLRNLYFFTFLAPFRGRFASCSPRSGIFRRQSTVCGRGRGSLVSRHPLHRQ